MSKAQSYRVEGTFQMGGDWRPYAKVVSAPNEAQAKERVYTLLGSKHRLKRREIRVVKVQPAEGE
ncbi:MAG TPA: 50S ribosomal protein L18Ae [Methanomicrobiales archaeon]|jgi:large subunit ribosomal protein LX|nr:50S ribosomal protein L18Ae [Methanomicrobiales archaeon]